MWGMQCKRSCRDVLPAWVANQPPGISMTSYFMQNMVYEWVNIQIFHAKIGSNLSKSEGKKSAI